MRTIINSLLVILITKYGIKKLHSILLLCIQNHSSGKQNELDVYALTCHYKLYLLCRQMK